MDYINGGCEFNLMIAVDFTESNLIPSDPASLHHLRQDRYNDYEKALYGVGEILLNYDSDKRVPLYGFGGKINNKVDHCFPMNFNPLDHEVEGLANILLTYRNALLKPVNLSGPTIFGRVIQKAREEAQNANVSQDNQQYYVLLILTDGEISDMKNTLDEIVYASHFPLSIVIIGLGEECDFKNMVFLDGDDKVLYNSRGEPS